ncbi:MAG TPA: hypothetical protein VEZ47_02265 [Gemmatirosa sp.]|nr:hypothetical protein [Gemmatirosa sp.]
MPPDEAPQLTEHPADDLDAASLGPCAELAALHAADRAEHAAVPPVETPAYAALRARDRVRRARAVTALERLRALGVVPPAALYHAAWLLNHGETPEDASRAHALAREAAEAGYAPARWLAAAAYDRACMYAGRPQRYGTQFVPDGMRYRLWDVEPATSDAERAAWDVPALAEQHARAEAMTRAEPQPPMDGAPAWLKDAVARWRAAEAEGDRVRALHPPSPPFP